MHSFILCLFKCAFWKIQYISVHLSTLSIPPFKWQNINKTIHLSVAYWKMFNNLLFSKRVYMTFYSLLYIDTFNFDYSTVLILGKERIMFLS